jgi:peptide/nickel transport system substrate-binding protein
VINQRPFYLYMLVIGLVLSGCDVVTATPPIGIPEQTQAVTLTAAPTNIPNTPPPTPAPEPRLLTICTGLEPGSLFIFGGSGGSARNIWEAIYDGPFDVYGFQIHPVIFENLQNDGYELAFEPVEVQPGEPIIDSSGKWTTLTSGVIYRPSECLSPDCAQTYTGTETALMDRLVIRYKLLDGLQWSDGSPLTARDSVYGYTIANSIYPAYRPETIDSTHSYQALDELTIEWQSIPGLQNARYDFFFFHPLPHHAWGHLPAQELFSSEVSTRNPMGWGPYQIEEWTPGDHISLSPNPYYFRSEENLPIYDSLVFRFVSTGTEALDALLAGECDLADETTRLESQTDRLIESEASGALQVILQAGTGMEQALFGIEPVDPTQPRVFNQKEVRQAIAYCIDQEAIFSATSPGFNEPLTSYTHPWHPFFNQEIAGYDYDPVKANEMLSDAGWVMAAGDASGPRSSLGVAGIPNGTLFQFSYLVWDNETSLLVGRIVAESLARCGIQVEVVGLDWQDLLGPGPEGPIFGRNFGMAQFGWITPFEPPCSLFLSEEIPGPFPAHLKGWGGANAAGYNNPEFDEACKAATSMQAEREETVAAHMRAQDIFAEDLPSIPLYLHTRYMAARADFCGIETLLTPGSALANLEMLAYGEDCR